MTKLNTLYCGLYRSRGMHYADNKIRNYITYRQKYIPVCSMTFLFFSIQTEVKEAEKPEATTAPQTEKKLTNQFNFCERASQTYNNPYRVKFVLSILYCLETGPSLER